MSETRNKIQDAGLKIGGARKDFAKKALSIDELDNFTQAEKLKVIKKDNIWPVPDYQGLLDDGYELKAVALIKVFRDSLAAKPRHYKGISQATGERNYVWAMGEIRDALMGRKTFQEMYAAEAQVMANLGWAEKSPPLDVKCRYYSVWKGKKSPLFLGKTAKWNLDKLIGEGFCQDVPEWRKGKRVLNIKGVYLAAKGNKAMTDLRFPDEEAALQWIKSDYERENQVNKKDTSMTVPETTRRPSSYDRRRLENLHRTGPDVRQGRDISPEDLMSEFGFRAVEFGNWLPDRERQEVLNTAFEALHDLARAIDYPARGLSLNGSLAIAFGSRGGGYGVAHYETGRQVINMTRLRGGGSLAHEFSHALDHWLALEGGNRQVENGEVSFSTGQTLGVAGRGNRFKNLPVGVRQRLSDLVEDLKHSPVLEWTYRKSVEVDIAEIGPQLEAARERLEAADKDRVDMVGKEALIHAEILVQRLEGKLQDRLLTLEQLDAGTKKLPNNVFSQYYKNAVALSGHGGYRTRPTEMMARAFECAVYDRLLENGERSEYLVFGVDDGLMAGPPGDPYPAGAERKFYNAEIMRLVDAATELLNPAFLEQTQSLSHQSEQHADPEVGQQLGM